MPKCPWCGADVPAEDYGAHMAGIDRNRLECPHQDIAEIKEADRPALVYRDDAW